MTLSNFVLCFCFALIITQINKTNSLQPQKPPRLVLLSLDGFRFDYLHPKLTPFLYQLSQSGTSGPNMKSMLVTKTFPNHYSIATGLYEESHGVLANNMFDPEFNETFRVNNLERKWWDNGHVKPIWVIKK
jgi:predicted AlkP superfamily pyrophosphatase or phosphodiesterase